MRVSHTFAGDFGDNVFTEIVAGSVIFIVCRQQFIQVIGVKNVNAILASDLLASPGIAGDSPVFRQNQ